MSWLLTQDHDGGKIGEIWRRGSPMPSDMLSHALVSPAEKNVPIENETLGLPLIYSGMMFSLMRLIGFIRVLLSKRTQQTQKLARASLDRSCLTGIADN